MAAMMPLSEIHAVSRTLDEASHSPVADALAAPWGIGPGRSCFVRPQQAHPTTRSRLLGA
ncbi:hypothetical protein [Nonomuraea sp. NPDC050786]|uniref:hypothetical protein n=1 Tax=Nonomuraea sp. NPDC050786 TaxID=3154840 RepID=UPI0033C63306